MTTLDALLLIGIGVRAAIPLQFEPWERWPGIACMCFGAASLIWSAL